MNAEYLPRRLYLRVRELLADGLSHAQIAASVPVGLATIEGIATGELRPSRIVVDADDPEREQMLAARRCPGCGAMVYVWPCLGCQVASGQPAPAQRLGGLRLKRLRARVRKKAA